MISTINLLLDSPSLKKWKDESDVHIKIGHSVKQTFIIQTFIISLVWQWLMVSLLGLINAIAIFCALILYFFGTGSEMTVMANKLGYDREVVRVWFCNKRQALKNASKRLKPDTSTTTTLDNHTSPPISLWFCKSNLIRFNCFGFAFL